MTKPSEVAAAAPIVYVIDDDDGMRRALNLLLSTVGYKTLAFANRSVSGAIRPGHSHGPGARYSDAGHEQLSAARGTAPARYAGHFITGHSDDGGAGDGGGLEFIRKPFRDQDLDRINHALQRMPKPQQPARRADVYPVGNADRASGGLDMVARSANKCRLEFEQRTVEIHRARSWRRWRPLGRASREAAAQPARRALISRDGIRRIPDAGESRVL